MQITRLKCISFSFITLNLLSIYLLWRYISNTGNKTLSLNNQYEPLIHNQKIHNDILQGNISVTQLVTIVIHDFEDYDNDVANTVSSALSVFPNIKILILSEVRPYPPLKLPNVTNVQVITTDALLYPTHVEHDAMNLISTHYVLFIPDSTRFEAQHQVKQMIISLEKSSHAVSLVAARFMGSTTLCKRVTLNLREWTLSFAENGDFRKCDALEEKQAVLIRREHLSKFPDPFVRPYPEGIYLQAVAMKRKVRLLRNVVLQNGRALFEDSHRRWKFDKLKQQRLDLAYRKFGIKKVVFENNEVEYHGCQRSTPRCFPTVVDDTPNYLYLDRWTPPCCLEALRETARHVFKTLDDNQVRYWLEGGSLLGAARNGDIIPWDYDVDIGIYKEDVEKCKWLQAASKETVTDDNGYVWEKAREGDFFRVQYSYINRLHVDIFPFYSSNGIMTKDTWFPTHKQDMEFPESYLTPLSSIEFVGVDASCPNNIREFLEMKFGEGAIENMQYPDPKVIKFRARKEDVEKLIN